MSVKKCITEWAQQNTPLWYVKVCIILFAAVCESAVGQCLLFYGHNEPTPKIEWQNIPKTVWSSNCSPHRAEHSLDCSSCRATCTTVYPKKVLRSVNSQQHCNYDWSYKVEVDRGKWSTDLEVLAKRRERAKLCREILAGFGHSTFHKTVNLHAHCNWMHSFCCSPRMSLPLLHPTLHKRV